MNIEPAAIVRSIEVDHAQLNEYELDQILDNEVKSRSQSLLKIGEILLILEETRGYERLGSGHQSLAEYVKIKFDRSKAWTTALCRVIRRFNKELEVPIEDLALAGYPKLNKVVGIVNEENLEEVLEKCKTCTQAELGEYVKEINGDEDLTESDEERYKVLVEGSTTNMGGIERAMDQSRIQYAHGQDLSLIHI